MPLTSYAGPENITSRIREKTVTGTTLEKRAALGDLGNRLVKPTQNAKLLKNGTTKTVMGPPMALPKKTAVVKPIVQQSKENIAKKPTNSIPIAKDTSVNKKPIVSERSAVQRKPTLVRNASQTSLRQESTLSFSGKQLSNIIDPDEATKDDPQHVNEYLPDIFNYLREMETKYEIRQDFLNGHRVTVKQRLILINWLVDVQLNFKLCLETLHMCIGLLDRFLQDARNVGKDTLQLVGVTALFVACKYEEMYMPDIRDFVYVTDNTFTTQEILQTERRMLRTFDFNLGRPLSIHFLRRYSKVAQVEFEKHVLGKYLLELALLEYDLAHVKPSIQAAAACCLAIAIIDEVLNPSTVWTPTLVSYSTYRYSEFKTVVYTLAGLLLNAKNTKYDAVCTKYASVKHKRISLNPKLSCQMVKKLADIAKKSQSPV